MNRKRFLRGLVGVVAAVGLGSLVRPPDTRADEVAEQNWEDNVYKDCLVVERPAAKSKPGVMTWKGSIEWANPYREIIIGNDLFVPIDNNNISVSMDAMEAVWEKMTPTQRAEHGDDFFAWVHCVVNEFAKVYMK
jgi:hypothetical protein